MRSSSSTIAAKTPSVGIDSPLHLFSHSHKIEIGADPRAKENLLESSACPRLGVLHHPTADGARGFAAERERNERESLSARARGAARVVRRAGSDAESKSRTIELREDFRESGRSGLC